MTENKGDYKDIMKKTTKSKIKDNNNLFEKIINIIKTKAKIKPKIEIWGKGKKEKENKMYQYKIYKVKKLINSLKYDLNSKSIEIEKCEPNIVILAVKEIVYNADENILPYCAWILLDISSNVKGSEDIKNYILVIQEIVNKKENITNEVLEYCSEALKNISLKIENESVENYILIIEAIVEKVKNYNWVLRYCKEALGTIESKFEYESKKCNKLIKKIISIKRTRRIIENTKHPEDTNTLINSNSKDLNVLLNLGIRSNNFDNRNNNEEKVKELNQVQNNTKINDNSYSLENEDNKKYFLFKNDDINSLNFITSTQTSINNNYSNNTEIRKTKEDLQSNFDKHEIKYEESPKPIQIQYTELPKPMKIQYAELPKPMKIEYEESPKPIQIQHKEFSNQTKVEEVRDDNTEKLTDEESKKKIEETFAFETLTKDKTMEENNESTKYESNNVNAVLSETDSKYEMRSLLEIIIPEKERVKEDYFSKENKEVFEAKIKLRQKIIEKIKKEIIVDSELITRKERGCVNDYINTGKITKDTDKEDDKIINKADQIVLKKLSNRVNKICESCQEVNYKIEEVNDKKKMIITGYRGYNEIIITANKDESLSEMYLAVVQEILYKKHVNEEIQINGFSKKESIAKLSLDEKEEKPDIKKDKLMHFSDKYKSLKANNNCSTTTYSKDIC